MKTWYDWVISRFGACSFGVFGEFLKKLLTKTNPSQGKSRKNKAEQGKSRHF
ncbi:MAG TPA: hypothetical protein VGO59_18875 [Verrucomicrobiae bacterium]